MQLKIKRGGGDEIGRLLKDGEAEIAIAGPLPDSWERLDQWPIREERFDLIVSREHRAFETRRGPGRGAARRAVPEARRLRDECRSLRARSPLTAVDADDAHEVESEQDFYALLEANFGLAIGPATGSLPDKLVRRMIDGIDVKRNITLYGIAGRRRSPAASALLNLLRATDWSRTIN